MCVAVFGFYDGGAINLSVRCVGPSAVFCAMCVILSIGTSSRAFLPRFPLHPFSRYSIGTRFRALWVGRRRLFVCLRCNLFSLAYFMISLYLILTVQMLLFTFVFRDATAVNLGITLVSFLMGLWAQAFSLTIALLSNSCAFTNHISRSQR